MPVGSIGLTPVPGLMSGGYLVDWYLFKLVFSAQERQNNMSPEKETKKTEVLLFCTDFFAPIVVQEEMNEEQLLRCNLVTCTLH
jgi:hypothetical protein